MKTVFYIFGIIVLFKFINNLRKYLLCKRYLKKFKNWANDPSWEFVEYKSRVIKLLKDAGVKDSILGIANPIGYGQILTGNASVMQNFPSRREDAYVAQKTMLHEAIGTYYGHIAETINPLYWIESLIFLPKRTLTYLGLSSEHFIVKVFQLIYWILCVLGSCMLTLYKEEFTRIIDGWITNFKTQEHYLIFLYLF